MSVRFHTCIQKVCTLSGIRNSSRGLLLVMHYACRPGGARHHLTSTAMSFGYQQTQSNLSLSLFQDPRSHPSYGESPGRLEFSSLLPFLFFSVYLLFSNSFQSPPPLATHYRYRLQLHADTNTRAHHERNMCFYNVVLTGYILSIIFAMRNERNSLVI